jgi:hypothetical protein
MSWNASLALVLLRVARSGMWKICAAKSVHSGFQLTMNSLQRSKQMIPTTFCTCDRVCNAEKRAACPARVPCELAEVRAVMLLMREGHCKGGLHRAHLRRAGCCGPRRALQRHEGHSRPLVACQTLGGALQREQRTCCTRRIAHLPAPQGCEQDKGLQRTAGSSLRPACVAQSASSKSQRRLTWFSHLGRQNSRAAHQSLGRLRLLR